jgi:uroporphyrinogen-III synthase
MNAEHDSTSAQPLLGRHIAITRAPEQAPTLARALEDLGARVTVLSAIAIHQLDDPSRLDAVLKTISEYDWIVLTSANGVRAVADRLHALGLTWETRGRARIAVIGPATAEALEARGITPDLVPDEYVAESIVESLGNVAGQRILLARADIARKTLAQELRLRGADVDEVAAYRTEALPLDAATLDDVLRRDPADAITFTSSSTAHSLMRSLRQAGMEPADALANITICAIGPITAATLREYGVAPDVVAETYTIPGMVAALSAYFMACASA